MPPWRKAWIVSRFHMLMKLGIIDKGDQEENLYTIPDSWSKNLSKSNFEPRNYISPKNLGYLNHQLIRGNKEYLENLSIANDLKSTAIESLKLKDANMKEINLKIFKEKIKYGIGFNPIRKSKYNKEKALIFDRNNIPIPYKKLIGDKKKIVLALHGRSSNPKSIVGEHSDYTNQFGKFWNSYGYTVYALGVQPIKEKNLSFPRLGLSLTGSDLAKIEDFLLYLDSEYGQDAHISLVGISYGGKLAELSGILFKRPNSIISIGAGARYEYLLSHFSLSQTNKIMNSDSNLHLLNHYLKSSDIFRIINSTGKLLHVSIGIVDGGQWGESGQTKFKMMSEVSNKMLFPQKFSYSFFKGAHETNPLDEIEKLEKLIKLEMKSL